MILLLQILLLFTKLKYFSLIFGIIGNFFFFKILYLIYNSSKEFIYLNKFIQIKKIISKDELYKYLDILISDNNHLDFKITSDVKQELVLKSTNRVDLEQMFNELIKYYTRISKVESNKSNFNIYDYFTSISSFIYDNRQFLLVISSIVFVFGTYFYIRNYFQNENINHLSNSVQNLITNETREQRYINNLSNDFKTIIDSVNSLDNEIQNSKEISQELKINYLKLAEQLKHMMENIEKLSSNDGVLLQKINFILENPVLNSFFDGFTVSMVKFLSLYIKDMMEELVNAEELQNQIDTQQSRSPTFTGSHRLGSDSSSINNNNDM